MSRPIEDYALLSDCHSAALVSTEGSIDWLCWPRFDSRACFAALLGTWEHGRWLIAPVGGVRAVRRRYRQGTLILETTFESEDGEVTLIDFMPMRGECADLVRIVVGGRGSVLVRSELVMRFDYGTVVPWVQAIEGGIQAIGGPDMLVLRTPVPTHGEGPTTVADFTVRAGDRIPFVLTHHPSHVPHPPPSDAERLLTRTEETWCAWLARGTWDVPHPELVKQSLVVLKGLTYQPTGAVVASPTTSLPEHLGGSRNWDYRYCWIRDATFTLYALLDAGFVDEARRFRDWLMRAAAGEPSKLQIVYGVAGERRLPELELEELPGYAGSRPVRIGNAASRQLQLDVYGELLDTMHVSRRMGLIDDGSWALERALVAALEDLWHLPDEGIWEVRSARRPFVHSKVMAWVAFDRAVKAVEQFGREGPVDRWRALRAHVHEAVCRDGFDPELGSFVQSYGSKALDGSLLMIPLVGFLPPDDPRVLGTTRAIEERLCWKGLVKRYESDEALDGLPPGEGVFLPCSFWLADNLILQGRASEARALYDRLAGLANDVGLFAEEYDPVSGRMLGNHPQAFTHVSLVNTAVNLHRFAGPARHREAG